MGMRIAIAAIVLLGTVALTPGQATRPATRPAGGAVAASATAVTPLRQGAGVPRVTLSTAEGRPFDLHAAVLARPTVLFFYRGGWCSTCTLRLRGLQGILPDLESVGYQVLALSPDRPERVHKTTEELGLGYTVLSDPDAVAAIAFGVAYRGAAEQFKKLEDASGASHHVLAAPTIYLTGTDGTIRFVDVDPDSAHRLSYTELLEHARAALGK